jgi:hypothetical protein
MACTRWLPVVAAASIAAAVAVAAPAAADPDDLVPWCSGDQTPMDSHCRVAPSQVFTHDHNPGANPQVPVGLDPGEQALTP